jgi:hypothetical protein
MIHLNVNDVRVGNNLLKLLRFYMGIQARMSSPSPSYFFPYFFPCFFPSSFLTSALPLKPYIGYELMIDGIISLIQNWARCTMISSGPNWDYRKYHTYSSTSPIRPARYILVYFGHFGNKGLELSYHTL